MSQLFGRSTKDTPREAEIPSHRYLLRAGLIRQYASGIYGLLPLAKRSIAKIEKIIREEIDSVDGQEISMPCLATKELWEESGRYAAIDKSMFRLSDRNDKAMVLNMTHEEPVVFLARTELTSYKHLPAMLYQIQTKFRDEPRPRGGLIRLREFSMKDAYSFHETEEDLKQFYDRMHAAYERIFKRAGLKRVVSVLSDNGMFGGKFSHEFQLLVPTGEDKLITCPNCAYGANEEIARADHASIVEPHAPLDKVHTPGIKTIDTLSNFLGKSKHQTIKVVFFETISSKRRLIAAFIRGNLDVVPMKLRTLIGEEIKPASNDFLANVGIIAGFAGPIGINLDKVSVVFDHTVLRTDNAIVGANEVDHHFNNFNATRDFLNHISEEDKKKIAVGDLAIARADDPCPSCGTKMEESRGIEVGNIFHLGTKYSAAMKCTFLDCNGQSRPHIMGCYGIGVTRLLPAVIEENHDDRGIIFPISIAPYEIHMCILNSKNENVRNSAESLCDQLKKSGIEILIDDRDGKAGSQFADADLIGIPIRVVISPKSLEAGVVEVKFRDQRSEVEMIKLDQAYAFLRNLVENEYKKYLG